MQAKRFQIYVHNKNDGSLHAWSHRDAWGKREAAESFARKLAAGEADSKPLQSWIDAVVVVEVTRTPVAAVPVAVKEA